MNQVINNSGLAFIVVTLLSACASKESFNTAKEINEQCNMEMQAARTAVRLRDKGKPQAFLQDQLPPIKADSSRLLINLHDIVVETYQFNELNETVYPTYRFELCMRQLQNKRYPINLTVMKQPLLDCQQLYGLQSTEQSTACIMQAIEHLPADQFVDPNIKSVSTQKQ